MPTDETPAKRPFAQLCDVAERNGFVVEVWTNPAGEQAIWVLPSAPSEFEIAGTTAQMRVGIVATPFMRDLPHDAASPQLIAMLKERGYAR